MSGVGKTEMLLTKTDGASIGRRAIGRVKDGRSLAQGHATIEGPRSGTETGGHEALRVRGAEGGRRGARNIREKHGNKRKSVGRWKMESSDQ